MILGRIAKSVSRSLFSLSRLSLSLSLSLSSSSLLLLFLGLPAFSKCRIPVH